MADGLGGFLSKMPTVQLYKGVGKMLGLGEMGDASDTYQQYLQKALGTLQQHEAAGRQAMTGYYGQALGFGAPYREAGAGALGAYQGTLGLGGPQAQQQALTSFRASPGYQFAMQQGLQGVQRQMAARGLGGSGAEMRALQGVGQGLAQQEYGQYQQRLAGLAGMGQQQAGQAAQLAYGTGAGLAGMGQQYAGDIASLYGTMGAAQAEAERARREQQSSMLGTFGQLAGAGIGFVAQHPQILGLAAL